MGILCVCALCSYRLPAALGCTGCRALFMLWDTTTCRSWEKSQSSHVARTLDFGKSLSSCQHSMQRNHISIKLSGHHAGESQPGCLYIMQGNQSGCHYAMQGNYNQVASASCREFTVRLSVNHAGGSHSGLYTQKWYHSQGVCTPSREITVKLSVHHAGIR